jgi:hypothetical protein
MNAIPVDESMFGEKVKINVVERDLSLSPLLAMSLNLAGLTCSIYCSNELRPRISILQWKPLTSSANDIKAPKTYENGSAVHLPSFRIQGIV